MIRSATQNFTPPLTSSVSAASAAPSREQTPAEKMLGGITDPKLRERLLKDLNKLPPGALDKLQGAGWSVKLVDNSAGKDDVTTCGQCKTRTKTVELDRKAYENDPDGKILLHEFAHALDFKGCEAPGLLRKLLGVEGKTVLATDTNPAMGAIFQRFQAQNMVSMANTALAQIRQSNPEAKTVAFSTPFHGDLQAAEMEGKLLVVSDHSKSADQAKAKGVKTSVGETPAQMDIHGVQVVSKKHGKNDITVVDQKDAGALDTSWTKAASYVAASNLPSELFAEGVAAYLSNPESRESLSKQSPDLYAFVESSMNEFLIADHR